MFSVDINIRSIIFATNLEPF